MNTSIAKHTHQQSALSVMAQRFNCEPSKLLETLKSTAFKNATSEEMMALVVVANEYNLNPFTKEIFAFPAKGGGITPVVSVDGWIRLMNSHPQMDGIEFDEVEKDGKPFSCTAIIWRKDRTRPTKVTEYFSECYRNTDPWNTKPRRMLKHKATIQCARTAFGFTGIKDEDDVITIHPEPEKKDHPKFSIPETTILEISQHKQIEEIPIEKQTPKPEPAPVEKPTDEQPAPTSPHAALAEAIAGVPFDDFRDFANIQWKQDISAYATLEELPTEFVERALKRPKDLAKCKLTFGSK